MDYTKMTREKLVEENKEKILFDYKGVEYMYLMDVKSLFGFQRSFIYRMIKDGKLEHKDFGSSRFIKVNSVWKVIDEKARKVRAEIIKENLENIASEALDKIAKEVLQEADLERAKQPILQTLSKKTKYKERGSKKNSK